jgi:DNA-binding NarL/FixJ family response regulator
MNAQGFGSAAHVLLIDSNNMVRSTVASVCRDMKLVRLRQATSLALGEQCLLSHRVQGLMLSMAEGDAAIDLLERLRAGAFVCDVEIAVMVMADVCTKDQVLRLKALNVRRLLLQPFRLRDMVYTVEQLWPLADPNVGQQTLGVAAVY